MWGFVFFNFMNFFVNVDKSIDEVVKFFFGFGFGRFNYEGVGYGLVYGGSVEVIIL